MTTTPVTTTPVTPTPVDGRPVPGVSPPATERSGLSATGRAPRGGGRRRRLTAVAAVAAAALVGGLTGAVVAAHRHHTASLADLMSLSPVPAHAAPGFTLTDQSGRRVSLAGFRGRAVVLGFMDPRCTDICPIVSQEFAMAYRDLGPQADRVEFLAVNVNQYQEGLPSVRQFSAEHGLTAVPTWHFLTGSTADLRSVWKAYGVAVEANPTGDVVHTSLLYFIDPSGVERYLAMPDTSKAYLTQWGTGIARYSARLLTTE